MAAALGASAWVPGIAVLAWLTDWALDIPPHGPLGHWVALLLAGISGGIALATWFFACMGLSWDRSPFPAGPVKRPVRRFLRHFRLISFVMVYINGVVLAVIWFFATQVFK